MISNSLDFSDLGQKQFDNQWERNFPTFNNEKNTLYVLISPIFFCLWSFELLNQILPNLTKMIIWKKSRDTDSD